MLSRVQLFVTLWTVAHQALMSMGFSRQEYWSGLPFPSSGDLPDPGITPASPSSPALQWILYRCTPRETLRRLPNLTFENPYTKAKIGWVGYLGYFHRLLSFIMWHLPLYNPLDSSFASWNIGLKHLLSKLVTLWSQLKVPYFCYHV